MIGNAGASLPPASVTMANHTVAFKASFIVGLTRSEPAARMAISAASVFRVRSTELGNSSQRNLIR
jgi:hypothetical protein